MRYLTLCLLLLISIASRAADFDVVPASDGGYTLAISGPIRSGDVDQLTEIFAENDALPSITRIKTRGGDIDEAMRLGDIYRATKLSVIASEACDTPCFLWLLGGVSRLVVGDLQLTFPDAEIARLRDYFDRMDLPNSALESLLNTGRSGRVTPAAFDAIVGERPASFESWLAEQCGEQEAEEKRDLQRIQAASFLTVLRRMQSEDPAREDLEGIIAKYEKLALEAGKFTTHYKQTLMEEWFQIRRCRKLTLSTAQREALETLLDSSAAESAELDDGLAEVPPGEQVAEGGPDVLDTFQ